MKIIFRIILILLFFIILFFIIAYARGYRIDKKGKLSSTGIIAISSNPKAAKIFINQEFKGVTDQNFTFPSGNYQIEIKKDGYTSWNKKVTLKGELVISLDGLLFPLNPSLSPLTNLGIVKAVPLDQTDKILIFTDNNDESKDGIYIFDAGKKPLSLLVPLKLIVLKKNLPQSFDLSSATVFLSPDFKQAIIEFVSEEAEKPAYLLSLEEENKEIFDISSSKEILLEAWEKQKEKIQLKILETFPKDIVKVATDSLRIIAFSPNETKFLYQAKQPVNLPFIINPPLIASNQTPETRLLKKDRLYVYDKKEDKNFEIGNWKLEISNFIQWYPDSKHLIYMDNKRIIVMDYDGINKQVVYSGPLDKSFFAMTTDGNLVILTNLNPEANKFPDLYAVGIK